MTWDRITLESPSFNASNAGTQLRLPTAVWNHDLQDANPGIAPVGNDEAPVKADVGMYREVIVIRGQISQKTATDTAIWNPTIIEGVSRTALANWQEFRDLLKKTKNDWWKEAAAGNWHNDGTPARDRGLCRLRLDDKWNGVALVGNYVYGHVAQISFQGVSSARDSGFVAYQLNFEYADVESY